VKTWSEYKENLGNPISDVDKYINGLSNKIILMQPDEVEFFRHKLTELHNLIERKLDSNDKSVAQ